MFAMMGFGGLATVLFLTFAVSGITWLVATIWPGASPEGRRSVGIVAGISGIALVMVFVVGAVLGANGGLPGRRFAPQPFPFRPAPGQLAPAPGQPGPLATPAPTR